MSDLTPGTWTVEPQHSSVGFTVRHLGLSKVRGRFNRFDARLVVGDSVTATQVSAEIDLSSVDTNNADRDAHLASTDFFDAAKFPTATFKSTNVEKTGDNQLEDQVGDAEGREVGVQLGDLGLVAEEVAQHHHAQPTQQARGQEGEGDDQSRAGQRAPAHESVRSSSASGSSERAVTARGCAAR